MRLQCLSTTTFFFNRLSGEGRGVAARRKRSVVHHEMALLLWILQGGGGRGYRGPGRKRKRKRRQMTETPRSRRSNCTGGPSQTRGKDRIRTPLTPPLTPTRQRRRRIRPSKFRQKKKGGAGTSLFSSSYGAGPSSPPLSADGGGERDESVRYGGRGRETPLPTREQTTAERERTFPSLGCGN